MTTTPSHREWLHRLVADILPPGEEISITETPIAAQQVAYNILLSTGRAKGILLGRGGETIAAVRRVLAVYLGTRQVGYSAVLNVDLKEPDNVSTQVLPTRS